MPACQLLDVNQQVKVKASRKFRLTMSRGLKNCFDRGSATIGKKQVSRWSL